MQMWTVINGLNTIHKQTNCLHYDHSHIYIYIYIYIYVCASFTILLQQATLYITLVAHGKLLEQYILLPMQGWEI